MKNFIDTIIDYFDSLKTWQKWLGTSVTGVIIFFLILLIFAGPQETKKVAEVPLELKEAQLETTQKYIEETKGPVIEIIKDFWEIGKKLSEDVNDPIVKIVIRFSWLLLGIMIGGMIIIIPVVALYRAFQKIL